MSVAAAKMLNPIDPAKANQLLAKLAASDAKHDFATIFINIFARNKNIGTSIAPTETFDEWGSFFNIFDHTGNIPKDPNYIFKGDKDPGKAFRNNICSGEGTIINNIGLANELNANHTYSLKSKLFFDGSPRLSGEEFMRFLGGDTKSKIFVQQDASFISFADFFLDISKNPKGAGQKSFVYISSREGQNDAAGKTGSDSAVIKKTGDKTIKVEINEDNDTKDKKYPKYETDKNSDVYQNFQSIYNLSLSPIRTVKGVKLVSLDFYDKTKINSTQKGKAENAKGNLKSRLTEFFKNITKASGRSNNDSYFTALQQKRSGDWLQVLSTYDVERYNNVDRIIVITHDTICCAYAIAMGVDVILTVQKGNEKWIVYFQNENYLELPTNKIIKDRYNHIKKNVNDFLLTSLTPNIATYSTSRETQIASFLQDITRERANAFLIQTQTTKDYHDITTNKIKALLNVYFRYAIAISIFPPGSVFSDRLAALISIKNKLESLLDSLPNNTSQISIENLERFRTYEKTMSDIYNIKESMSPYFVTGGAAGGIQIIDLNAVKQIRFSAKSKDLVELNVFLDSFTPFTLEDNSNTDSKAFLNRFKLKNNMFNTQKKNDYAIFTLYLSKLDATKQKEILDQIKIYKNQFKTKLNEIPDTATKVKPKIQALDIQFDRFIDEISLYFSDAKAPNFEAGSTAELLDEIQIIEDDQDVEIIDGGIVVGGNLNKKKNRKNRKDQSGGSCDDCMIATTPFVTYLIWILKRREEAKPGIISMIGKSLGGVGAIAGAGASLYFHSTISSFMSLFPGTQVDGWGNTIFIGAADAALVGAGVAMLKSVWNDINSVDRLSIELNTNAYASLTNDNFIKAMQKAEQKATREVRIQGLIKAGIISEGGMRSGDSFDLPYQGWTTLYFHLDTLKSQLGDIGDVDNSFDFEYLARYAQFLIAMEKSIKPTMDFFSRKNTIKRGGQPQGTRTVVLTEEELPSYSSSIEKTPDHLVLHLRTSPESGLYEIPIGQCALFTSFGNYCDLILSNILPRIYFDPVWDEAKFMLNKAFGISADSEAKWPGIIAEVSNENYLNKSADRDFDEFLNEEDIFLRYFLLTTCHTLEQMPIFEQTNEAKNILEKELNTCAKRLIQKINLYEKNILLNTYRKKAADPSITFENIDDLDFLLERNLVNISASEDEPNGGSRRRSYKKTRRLAKKRISRLKSRRRT